MPNTLYYNGTWTKTPWKETVKCSRFIQWEGWQRRDSMSRNREYSTSDRKITDIQAPRALYNTLQVHSGPSQSPEHRVPQEILSSGKRLSVQTWTLPSLQGTLLPETWPEVLQGFISATLDLAIELLSLKQVQADKQNFYSNYGFNFMGP